MRPIDVAERNSHFRVLVPVRPSGSGLHRADQFPITEAPVAGARLALSLGVLIAVPLLALNLRPAVTSVGAMLTDIQSGTGMSAVLASAVVAAPVWCFAVGGALAWAMRSRFGTTRTVSLALAALAVTLAARVLAGPYVLLAGTVVACLAIAVLGTLLPVITHAAPARAWALLTGCYIAAMGGGSGIGALVTPQVAGEGSWQLGVSSWALLAAAAWAAWRVASRKFVEPAVRAKKHPGPGSLTPANTAWALTLHFGLTSGFTFSIMGWLPSILLDYGHVDPARVEWMFTVAMALGVPIALLVPKWARATVGQSGLVVVLAAPSLLATFGLLMYPAWSPWLWSIGLGLGMPAVGLALAMISLRAAPDGDTAAALSSMVQGVGYAIAGATALACGLLHSSTQTWEWPLLALMLIVCGQIISGMYAGLPITVFAGTAPAEPLFLPAARAVLPLAPAYPMSPPMGIPVQRPPEAGIPFPRTAPDAMVGSGPRMIMDDMLTPPAALPAATGAPEGRSGQARGARLPASGMPTFANGGPPAGGGLSLTTGAPSCADGGPEPARARGIGGPATSRGGPVFGNAGQVSASGRTPAVDTSAGGGPASARGPVPGSGLVSADGRRPGIGKPAGGGSVPAGGETGGSASADGRTPVIGAPVGDGSAVASGSPASAGLAPAGGRTPAIGAPAGGGSSPTSGGPSRGTGGSESASAGQAPANRGSVSGGGRSAPGQASADSERTPAIGTAAPASGRRGAGGSVPGSGGPVPGSLVRMPEYRMPSSAEDGALYAGGGLALTGGIPPRQKGGSSRDSSVAKGVPRHVDDGPEDADGLPTKSAPVNVSRSPASRVPMPGASMPGSRPHARPGLAGRADEPTTSPMRDAAQPPFHGPSVPRGPVGQPSVSAQQGPWHGQQSVLPPLIPELHQPFRGDPAIADAPVTESLVPRPRSGSPVEDSARTDPLRPNRGAAKPRPDELAPRPRAGSAVEDASRTEVLRPKPRLDEAPAIADASVTETLVPKPRTEAPFGDAPRTEALRPNRNAGKSRSAEVPAIADASATETLVPKPRTGAPRPESSRPSRSVGTSRAGEVPAVADSPGTEKLVPGRRSGSFVEVSSRTEVLRPGPGVAASRVGDVPAVADSSGTEKLVPRPRTHWHVEGSSLTEALPPSRSAGKSPTGEGSAVADASATETVVPKPRTEVLRRSPGAAEPWADEAVADSSGTEKSVPKPRAEVPLANRPRTESAVAESATETDVPKPRAEAQPPDAEEIPAIADRRSTQMFVPKPRAEKSPKPPKPADAGETVPEPTTVLDSLEATADEVVIPEQRTDSPPATDIREPEKPWVPDSRQPVQMELALLVESEPSPDMRDQTTHMPHPRKPNS